MKTNNSGRILMTPGVTAAPFSEAMPAHPQNGDEVIAVNVGSSTYTLTGSITGGDLVLDAGESAILVWAGATWIATWNSGSGGVTYPTTVAHGGTGANLSSANDGDLIAFNSGGGVFAASSIATLGIATTAELSGYVTLQASSPGSADTGGINVSLGGIFGGDVVGSGTGTAAHVAIGSGVGVDATINLTAVLPGVVGNVYTVEIVSGAPTPDVALGVVEAGTVTTITLGTDGAGVLDPAKNTATLVLAELGSSTLFTGALAGTGDDSLTVESQIFFGGAEAITAVTGNVAGVGGIFSGNVDAATFSSAGGDPFVLPAADLGGGGALVTDGSGNVSVATLAVIGTAVSLQALTPGTPDTGNLNISGIALASQFGDENNDTLVGSTVSNGSDVIVQAGSSSVLVHDSGGVEFVFAGGASVLIAGDSLSSGNGTQDVLYFRDGIFTRTLTAVGFTVADMQAAPASAGAAGVKGDIRWTDGFVYLCTATNTWLRAALTTWA